MHSSVASILPAVSLFSAAPPQVAPVSFEDLVSVHGTPLIMPDIPPAYEPPHVAPTGKIGRPFDAMRAFASSIFKRKIMGPRLQISKEEFFEIARPGNTFGIKGDKSGNWFYPPGARDALRSALGKWRIAGHKGDLLEVRVAGIRDRIFFHPQREEAPPPPYRLDIGRLAARAQDRENTFVFYKYTGTKRRRVVPKVAVMNWLKAVRELGYNVIVANSPSALGQAVRRHHPLAVLVSAVEDELPEVERAYFLAKEIDPSVVTVLGGMAAMPHLAKFFDIVAMGEGQIALPLILRKLTDMLSSGDLKRDVVPVSFETMIGGIDKYLSGENKISEWAAKFLRTRKHYPSPFSPQGAQSIADLSAERFIDANGDSFPMAVPIGYDSSGRGRIFVRSEAGIMNASPRPVTERYAEAVAAWRERYASAFPLTLPAFAKATEPYPVTETEYDSLFARLIVDQNRSMGHAPLYAQSGCRGDDRCMFCSIREKATGRRASVEHVIRLMNSARASGISNFTFNDDLFIQDRRWILKLLGRMKEEGLNSDIEMSIQTRVDTLTDELFEAFRGVRLTLSLGVETLSPRRAENMKKVRAGKGEKYVERAKKMIEKMREEGIENENIMILTCPGDTIIDVANDVLEQFSLTMELYKTTRMSPRFSYASRAAPQAGDGFTEFLSGMPFAQPGSIPVFTRSPYVSVGKVGGQFIPFGVEMQDEGPHVTGIFWPLLFEWPRTIEYFQDQLCRESMISLSKIYKALVKTATAPDSPIDPEERRELQKILDEIRPIYEATSAQGRAK